MMAMARSSSGAASPPSAAGRMRKRRRSLRPVNGRAAPPPMSPWSLAPTMVARRPAPKRWSLPALRASSALPAIPIAACRAGAMPSCAPPGLKSRSPFWRGKAAGQMSGYLVRSVKKRPEVTLKLALSADGMIGRLGAGQVAITGAASRAQAHLMRARSDAILVGIGTALADDPELTVRLPGLEARSPMRIVLDLMARLPTDSKLARSANDIPVFVACGEEADPARRHALTALGVKLFADRDLRWPHRFAGISGGSRRAAACRRCWSKAARTRRRLPRRRSRRSHRPVPLARRRSATDGIASPFDETHIPAGFAAGAAVPLRRRYLQRMGEGGLMFTGIVTDVGRIAAVTPAAQGRQAAHRDRLRSRRHRHRRVDRDVRRLPDRRRAARNGLQPALVRGRGLGRGAAPDHRVSLARGHARQSRARAEGRRRTRRPHRFRPCRRQGDDRCAPGRGRCRALHARGAARTGEIHRAERLRRARRHVAHRQRRRRRRASMSS